MQYGVSYRNGKNPVSLGCFFYKKSTSKLNVNYQRASLLTTGDISKFKVSKELPKCIACFQAKEIAAKRLFKNYQSASWARASQPFFTGIIAWTACNYERRRVKVFKKGLTRASFNVRSCSMEPYFKQSCGVKKFWVTLLNFTCPEDAFNKSIGIFQQILNDSFYVKRQSVKNSILNKILVRSKHIIIY